MEKMQIHKSWRETSLEFMEKGDVRRYLEWHDGPLMLEWEYQGQRWIVTWVDADDEAHRWLVFPSKGRRVQAYLEGHIPLYKLICSATRFYFTDRDGTKTLRSWEVRFRDIPDIYLPERDAYHDPDLEYVVACRA